MKKWLFSLIAITTAVLIAVGGLNFAVDPLMQYRKLPSTVTSVAYDYDYINPGVAKNFNYNAVLVGTSLAENTDMDEYEKIFNCNMIKMVRPGGTTKNYEAVLNLCFAKQNVEQVIWAIDDNLYYRDGSDYVHDIPKYLYDDNKLNDVNYLLNLSIFYNYTFKDIFNSARGTDQGGADTLLRGDAWGNSAVYGREAVMKYYHSLEKSNNDADLILDNTKDNLGKIILPMIKAHPDTEFTFFFPPKCITYWKYTLDNGELESRIAATKYFCKELLCYDNVSIYFFQNCLDLTVDFDIYKDNIHFNPDTNILLGQKIAAGEGKLSLGNYNKILNNFQTEFTEFNYNKYIY